MKLKTSLGPVFAFLATLAISAAVLTAQDLKSEPSSTIAKPPGDMVPAPAMNPLDAIAWLKGGTWVAEVKDKNGSVGTRIETRICGSENGRLIKFTTTFISHNKPDLHYEGVYLFNPQSKQIEFYYTDPDGNFTRGHAVFADKTLTQDFDIIHMDGQADTLRSLIVRDGENAYTWNVMTNKTGEWKEIFHLRYVREQRPAL